MIIPTNVSIVYLTNMIIDYFSKIMFTNALTLNFQGYIRRFSSKTPGDCRATTGGARATLGCTRATPGDTCATPGGTRATLTVAMLSAGRSIKEAN